MKYFIRKRQIARRLFITFSMFASLASATDLSTQKLRAGSPVSGAVSATQPNTAIQTNMASPITTGAETKAITQPGIRQPGLTTGTAQSLNPQPLPPGSSLIKPIPGANTDMAKPRITPGNPPTKHFSGRDYYKPGTAPLGAGAIQGSQTLDNPLRPPLTSVLLCGGQDQACCGPPVSQRSHINPPYCNKTLGCNVVTNKCERPCGKPGQVCCDGPETVAPKEGYSPTSFGLKPMCEASMCDRAKRRCIANCGMNAGDSCCRPSASTAIASCINRSLECELDDGSVETGICLPCGLNGIKPCAGDPCDAKLTLGPNGLCVPCGSAGSNSCQGTCDSGLIRNKRNDLCEYPPVGGPIGGRIPVGSSGGGGGASPPPPPSNPPSKCECPQSTDSACGIEIGSLCDPAGPRFCRPGMGCTRDSTGSLPYRCRPPDAFEASKWNCPRLPNESCWTKEQAKTLKCH